MSLRWCVCPAHEEAAVPLAVDVLMHHREQFRPSSTGHLIRRVLPAARVHGYRRERRMIAADVRLPGRDLWILHPHGVPAPAGVPPENVQVMLIDGSWREASAMAQEVAGWGRLISLPMAGESRYWLRAQADAARFSTVETLLFLLQMFGLDAAHDTLRAQFELHVYASLRTRGSLPQAEEFLATSPIREKFAAFIAQLNIRRPLEP